MTDICPPEPSLQHWRGPIDSLGTDRFGYVLLQSLTRWANVDFCAAIGRDISGARVLFANPVLEFVCDLAISELPSISADIEARVIRLNLSHLHTLPGDGRLSDCVLVRGRREGHAYGLILARSGKRTPFTEGELDCIRGVSGTALSLLAKHERLLRTDDEDHPSLALLADDVPRLEGKVLRYMPTLSRREAQVCARILRGMSTPGIAVDLNVRDDSVATYRKRAYRRLAIGTRLELIRLFIAGCTSRLETVN